MNGKKLFPELLFTAGGSSSGMRRLNFRKKFFRKLLFSIPEEVVPEQLLPEVDIVTSGRTSSGMSVY